MRFAGYVTSLALSLLAVATTTVIAAPGPTPTPIPASQCIPGPIQCCDVVQKASGPTATTLLHLLGIEVQDPNVLVGITCVPISVIGVGGNSCPTYPVCCQNNDFNGLVAIDCVPVNLSL